MLDQASPIIYKKINFNKFDKTEIKKTEKVKKTQKQKRKNSFSSNDSKELIANDNIEEELTSSKMFYDQISEKFIQVNHDNIRIYNKKATNLKKTVLLSLTKERVNHICVDKHLRYLLICLDKKNFIIVNLRTSKVMDMINYDLKIVKGIFFITKDGEHDEIKYCVVTNNRIEIFKINNLGVNETSIPLKTLKCNNIQSFSYDANFMILMVKKFDPKAKPTKFFMFSSSYSNIITHKFEFFNLSDEKNYSKSLNHDYPITIKPNTSNTDEPFGSFMNYFYGDKNSNNNNSSNKQEINESTKNPSSSNNNLSSRLERPECKSTTNKNKNLSDMETNSNRHNTFTTKNTTNNNINNNTNNEESICNEDTETKKNETQFFLTTLYFSLYFIVLNFEEKEIQIHQLVNMANIVKIRNIALNVSSNSSLQFVDNLIVYHDFEKENSIIIDLKSEFSDQPLMVPWPISSKELVEENENKKLETIDLNLEVNLKGDIETSIKYNNYSPTSMQVYENKLFYEMKSKFFSGNIVKDILKDEFYYIYFEPKVFYDNSPIEYQSIFHLIRRKNAKKTITNGIFDLIRKKNTVKIIKLIFTRLLSDYKLLIKPELMLLSSNSISNSNNNNISLITLELKNTNLLLNRKKMILKQSDVCDDLFKLFIYNNYNVDTLYVIELILFYINAVTKERLQVHVTLISVLISLLKKIENKRQVITMIVQYQSVPDNYELASFLIRHYFEFNEIHSLGLDMMKRLHKYDVIVLELIKKNEVCEALLFAKKFKVTIDFIPDEIKEILKKCIKGNEKKVLVEYLSC